MDESEPPATRAMSAGIRWITLALGNSDALAPPARGQFRSWRIALAHESEAGDQRLAVKTQDEAKEAAVRLVQHASAYAQLSELSGLRDNRLVMWTTERLFAGDLKILWRDWVPTVAAAPPPPRPSPPPPRPQGASRAPSSEPVVDSTFPLDLDVAAAAAALMAAANDGVPFCEECAKAAAAERNSAAPMEG